MGMCNFFWIHINNDFTIIAPLLFKLTRKDSSYNGDPLPGSAIGTFINLRKQLLSELLSLALTASMH